MYAGDTTSQHRSTRNGDPSFCSPDNRNVRSWSKQFISAWLSTDSAQLLWCTSVTLDLMLLFPCHRVIDTKDNLESLPDATGQTKSGFTWTKVQFIADESNFWFVGESVFFFTRNNTLHNWYRHTHLKKIVLRVARVCMSPPLKVYVKSWQTFMGLLRFSGLALTLGRC